MNIYISYNVQSPATIHCVIMGISLFDHGVIIPSWGSHFMDENGNKWPCPLRYQTFEWPWLAESINQKQFKEMEFNFKHLARKSV